MATLATWRSFIPEARNQGTPATDLVNSLIGIQDRREQRERLKRQEERQARLDEMAAEDRRRAMEWEDLQRKGAIAAMTPAYEEVLKQVAGVSTAEPQTPEPPPSEREKVTEKIGADGSRTRTVDRPLPVDPELGVPVDLNPEVQQQLNPDKITEEQINAAISGTTPQGTPEIIPLLAKQLQAREPMTASYQGQEITLPYREEAMRRKLQEAMMSPAGIQVQMYSQFRETPEERARREAANLDTRFENQMALLEARLAGQQSGAPKTRMAWDKKLQSARPITDSEWNADPERYTDVTTGRKSGETGAGRSAAVAGLIGSPNDPGDGLSIWSTVRRINKGNEPGIMSRVKGVAKRGEAALGYDLDTKTYLDQLAGMSSMIAKEFGESGRLSDQDIQRTVMMFPMPGETEAETERKMQNVYRIIQYAQGEAPRPDGLLGPGPETNPPMGTDEEPPDAR